MTDTAAEWDAIAEDWDRRRQAPSSTLPFFLQYAEGNVLDAGCGNGRNTRVLAETAYKVWALDSSKAMLETAKKNLEGTKNAEFVHGKIEELPFEDAKFDAVFCLAAAHHLPRKKQAAAFREFARVLKESGALCLTVWNRGQRRFRDKPDALVVPWKRHPRHYYFSDEDELKGAIEGAGFGFNDLFFEKGGAKVGKEGAQNVCIIAAKERAAGPARAKQTPSYF